MKEILHFFPHLLMVWWHILHSWVCRSRSLKKSSSPFFLLQHSIEKDSVFSRLLAKWPQLRERKAVCSEKKRSLGPNPNIRQVRQILNKSLTFWMLIQTLLPQNCEGSPTSSKNKITSAAAWAAALLLSWLLILIPITPLKRWWWYAWLCNT